MKATVLAAGLALAGPASALECSTIDDKMDAIEAMILDEHGKRTWSGLSIFALDDGSFQTFFYPDAKACEAVLTVTADCQVQGDVICKP